MMKKYIYGFLLGIAIIMQSRAEDELPWVAIGKFVNKSTIHDANFTSLVDRMTDSIVNTRKFQVIDNIRLKELINERQEKISTGMSKSDGKTPNTAIAGFLIYGTVMNFQLDKKETQNRYFATAEVICNIEMNLRFSDVVSGKILASKTVRGEYTSSRSVNNAASLKSNFEQAAFDGAVQKVCENACNALMELAYPAKIIAVNGEKSIYVNLTPEQTTKGDSYDVFKTEDELRDPDTGLSLGKTEILVARIRISELKPKYAIAELQSGDLAQVRPGLLLRRVEAAKSAEPDNAPAPPARRLLEKRF